MLKIRILGKLELAFQKDWNIVLESLNWKKTLTITQMKFFPDQTPVRGLYIRSKMDIYFFYFWMYKSFDGI